MIDRADTTDSLDLVWVDHLERERSLVKWLPDETVVISPLESGEVTVQRSTGPNGEPQLTVISEKSAKDRMRELLEESNTKAVQKVIDDLERFENR